MTLVFVDLFEYRLRPLPRSRNGVYGAYLHLAAARSAEIDEFVGMLQLLGRLFLHPMSETVQPCFLEIHGH